MKRLILASASPRRKEIMELAGLDFEIIPSTKEEHTTKTFPSDIVLELSWQKAEEIFEKTEGEVLVFGADTIVAFQNEILGKPKNEEDAIRMIKSYAGNVHEVYTGVTILLRDAFGGEKKQSFFVCTKVTVHAMSDEEIYRYVKTEQPYDKAGAYGIQGRFAPFIEKIDGDYLNVVGFPIAAVIQKTRELGIDLLDKEYQA